MLIEFIQAEKCKLSPGDMVKVRDAKDECNGEEGKVEKLLASSAWICITDGPKKDAKKKVAYNLVMRNPAYKREATTEAEELAEAMCLIKQLLH